MNNEGCKIKASDVVGTLGDVASVVPGIGPIVSIPLKIGKSILKLFGAGATEGFTQGELDRIMEVHNSFHARRKNGK